MTRRRLAGLIAGGLITVLTTSAALVLRAQPAPADLVVLGGRVLTLDPSSRVAQAVAIRDGVIVAVGDDGAVRPLVGARTRVIEARGRTVVPGLIDSHVHTLMAAPVEAVTRFSTLSSVGEIQAWVTQEAARTPSPAWVWTTRVFPTRVREGRFPTREELDAAAPGRAVVVDGGYAFVLSSAALAAAGITAQTPDPQGAAIVRAADGAPTGLLRNAAGMLARFRPAAAPTMPLEQIEALHRSYLASGITSIVERGGSVEGYRAYESLKASGRLRVRTTMTLQLPTGLAAADAARLIEAIPLKPREGDERLRVGPLKIAVDGGILLGTSYMREPYGPASRALYGDQGDAYRGFLTTTPEAIRAVMIAGQARGWQMTAHVTGDAGVDVVLDGFEAAQKAHPRADARQTLIHAYFPTPEVARRAAALGVYVDTQPAWFYKDVDTLLQALGPARLQHFIGLRTWRDAGAHVAINTDHMFGVDRDTAMNPFNPFLTIATATGRRTERGQVVGGDEAVSREQALRMMTIEAAGLTFDEKTRGSLEVGKAGDLAVLSDDVLAAPEARLRRIVSELTVVGGVVAYERGQGAK
jgi:predicted amidohydrolase YtcJ